MLKRWLSLMLITLIACQSVWAMADNHPLNKPSAEHVESSHSRDVSNASQSSLSHSNIEDTSSLNTASALDCSHCCHCHGSTPLFVSVSPLTLPQSVKQEQLLPYSQTHQTPYLTPDFRPPIA